MVKDQLHYTSTQICCDPGKAGEEETRRLQTGPSGPSPTQAGQEELRTGPPGKWPVWVCLLPKAPELRAFLCGAEHSPCWLHPVSLVPLHGTQEGTGALDRRISSLLPPAGCQRGSVSANALSQANKHPGIIVFKIKIIIIAKIAWARNTAP